MTNFDVEVKPLWERAQESITLALENADMSIEEIDSLFVSNIETSSNIDRQRHVAPLLSSLLRQDMPILSVQAGCGGGGVVLHNAIRYLKKSSSKNVLVLGVDNLATTKSEYMTDEMFTGAERIYEQDEGMIFPAINALVAQQYMNATGATSDDLALVSLKNHENAFLNPKARFYGKKVSLDAIRQSPVVADPLRLFDCSIPCNGAAAVIITEDKTDVKITGSAMHTTSLSPIHRRDMTTWSTQVLAAKEAYEQAGISANDIDVAEVHDAFTPVELLAYEDLGFCKRGEGSVLVKEKKTFLNGDLPVNTSGGLKAKGHPISPTGVSQVVEIVEQMRNEAGKRQVETPTYGLAHNVGGAGSVSSVHIFQKV